jgi:Kef-type K+ transport system membrane component KefB
MQAHLLVDISKAIIAATLVGLPAYFMGIPLILAYFLAGVLIGPHLGIGLIKNPTSIWNLSEVGLVLLMFILGLEINVKKLFQIGRAVLFSGLVQISGCLCLGFVFFKLLASHLTNYELVYLTAAGALSSTLIVVKILSDKMDLDSLPSRITIGILVMQDLFAIAFLAIQPSLEQVNGRAIAFSLSKVVALASFSFVLARYALPWIFRRAGKQPELLLILAMTWCFSMCGVADYLSLSIEMGALVAGISIASFPYHLEVVAKISSLRDFFITLFFVSLGLQVPSPSINVLMLSALIVFFVLFSRVLTVFPALHSLGYGNRASLLPAINLSQLSELSLVLASLGVAYNHISAEILSSFIFALAITVLISSYLMPFAHDIYKRTNWIFEKIGFKDHITGADSKINEHSAKPRSIVMLGFHREASSLLHEMQNRLPKEFLEKMMVVDLNPEAHRKLKVIGIEARYGDVGNIDTLRSLSLENAKLIVVAIPDRALKGTNNMKMLKILKTLAPDAGVIVMADNMSQAQEMYRSGASYVYMPRLVGAHYLVDVIERLRVNGPESIRPDAERFLTSRVEIIP